MRRRRIQRPQEFQLQFLDIVKRFYENDLSLEDKDYGDELDSDGEWEALWGCVLGRTEFDLACVSVDDDEVSVLVRSCRAFCSYGEAQQVGRVTIVENAEVW